MVHWHDHSSVTSWSLVRSPPAITGQDPLPLLIYSSCLSVEGSSVLTSNVVWYCEVWFGMVLRGVAISLSGTVVWFGVVL